jgi:hypothetical protein
VNNETLNALVIDLPKLESSTAVEPGIEQTDPDDNTNDIKAHENQL